MPFCLASSFGRCFANRVDAYESEPAAYSVRHIRRWPAYEAMSFLGARGQLSVVSPPFVRRQLTGRIVLEEAENTAVVVRDKGEFALVEQHKLVRVLLRKAFRQREK